MLQDLDFQKSACQLLGDIAIFSGENFNFCGTRQEKLLDATKADIVLALKSIT